ncbi:MAG: OmpH family outer membrane protein [Bacteroidota bacterium]|nr:OmpH family outer membrane protein [Bacteroidota bacterium]MDX5431238.1 OmpH family outer membrane protein [Bacteroidota bacterium]MDX5469977.1 OmpH family outer membrane protein [Bacteroidota bacterium]
MKKAIWIFFTLAGLLIPTFGQAQRFAFVDTDYILNLIPEYNSAQKQLDLMAFEWQKEIEKMRADIEKMKADLEAEKIFLVDEVKQQRESDIAKKEKELLDFQQAKFGVNGELFKKRQELIQPIQDRIFDAIQKVAKDNALDFIFDKAGGVSMLYTNPKYDRSEDVLEEMGIVIGNNGQGGPGGDTDDLPNEQPK